MTSFKADISKWVMLTKLSGSVVMRKLGFDAYKGVLMRAPVRTGRFRASNRIGLNKVDTSVEPPPPKDAPIVADRYGTEPTQAEMARGASELVKANWGDTIHITNSLPYAKRLEDGYSGQNSHMPDGIYGATFSELRANLQAAIRAATKAAKFGGHLGPGGGG